MQLDWGEAFNGGEQLSEFEIEFMWFLEIRWEINCG